MGEMTMQGIVQFFNRKKGFGFVTPDDRSQDLYVHATQLPSGHKYLNEGDRIEFTVGPEQRGHLVALNVRIVIEAARPVVRANLVYPQNCEPA